jgi:hypothetical protein
MPISKTVRTHLIKGAGRMTLHVLFIGSLGSVPLPMTKCGLEAIRAHSDPSRKNLSPPSALDQVHDFPRNTIQPPQEMQTIFVNQNLSLKV